MTEDQLQAKCYQLSNLFAIFTEWNLKTKIFTEINQVYIR